MHRRKGSSGNKSSSRKQQADHPEDHKLNQNWILWKELEVLIIPNGFPGKSHVIRPCFVSFLKLERPLQGHVTVSQQAADWRRWLNLMHFDSVGCIVGDVHQYSADIHSNLPVNFTEHSFSWGKPVAPGPQKEKYASLTEGLLCHQRSCVNYLSKNSACMYNIT